MPGNAEIVVPGRVSIGAWLNRGWEWTMEDIGWQVLIALISVLFVSIGYILVLGPVCAGTAVAGLRKARNGRLEVKDFFDGFTFFLPALLSSLLIMVFVFVGLIFLIVPGLVIMAMYLFTFHFMVDRNKDFWQAMESSRQMVSRDYFGFTLFTVMLGLINFLGVLFFGIGILLSLPVTWMAVTAAYLDFAGTPPAQGVPAAPPVRIE